MPGQVAWGHGAVENRLAPFPIANVGVVFQSAIRNPQSAIHLPPSAVPIPPAPESPPPSEGANRDEPFLLPASAGLLTDLLPLGLPALERALRTLTEPEADVAVRDLALLNWLGLSCWLLGATLTWAVARRSRGSARPLGKSDLLPETLS